VLNVQKDLGIARTSIAEIAACDTPAENAEVLRRVVEGDDRGPRRDIVIVNAAGVLYVAGVVDSLADGLKRAGEIIDNGAAAQALRRLVEFTHA
jgi:anthranilate phosphoribosyltransferase